MRTKLFLSFFIVIVIALVSNLIFEHFITKDFEDYVNGTREDKLYWILASVEGCYSDGRWDRKELHEAMHWAVMLGFDLKIVDADGREIISSVSVMEGLSPSMKKRMQGMVDLQSARGVHEPYPLYREGKEIGTLLVRELNRVGDINEKEIMFKKRGREFLVMSFLIAGGGAVLTAVFFSLFLSRPLRKMKNAVEALAKGDFSVRIETPSKRDEFGRLSESFNFMAEALEREEALRKRLTSNIAHELRTPLAVMKAHVEGMIDGVVTDHGEGLENIGMEVDKLIRLVEGIEDITKAEASFFSRRDYTEIDLRAFLSGVVTKLMPFASEKGLGMKILHDKAVTVSADRDNLERIVQNILTNAIKNTNAGGIWIDYGADRQRYFIEVRDSGSGIPEEKIPLIFKRFYRGDDSKGLGLGLAIVKELVDVMGGEIDLKSRVGEGTVIRLWLPSSKMH